MAGCIEEAVDGLPDWTRFKCNLNEQNDEIEALKSYYENTDYLEIFEEASQSENKKFSLQLKIPIETSSKPIRVEIWLPLDQLKKESSSESNKDPNKPSLERTISGKRAHATIECNYLSPIQVDISLPDSYPSENKPIFTITCDWLSRSQITDLSLKLNQIWEENQSLPILFTWFEWVKSNLVEYLNLFDPPNTINLTPMSEDDDSAHNDMRSAEEIIVDLMRHNFIEEIKEFRNTPQNCMICFDEKMGGEFIRLNGCKHHFCLACMSDMCRMHVKEGTIQLLKCPNTECKEFVPIDVMSQVLTDEEFDRWERLLFQRTLDTMEDVIYCPKCTNPIIVDQSDSHAYCMICNLDYCKLCKDMWHSGKCTSNEEKIQERVKRLQVTVHDLLIMTEAEIRARFKDSDFVLKLKKKTVENEDDTVLKKFLHKYLRCPKCKIPIEKMDGCNKVICHCGCIICYICGMQIQGYDHFENNMKCQLWTGQANAIARVPEPVKHEDQVRIERVLNLMPEQRRNIINCVTCGQRNLKLDKNNHIKCWLCKTNFCFECRKRIIGNVSAHFMGSKCKQHSE